MSKKSGVSLVTSRSKRTQESQRNKGGNYGGVERTPRPTPRQAGLIKGGKTDNAMDMVEKQIDPEEAARLRKQAEEDKLKFKMALEIKR